MRLRMMTKQSKKENRESWYDAIMMTASILGCMLLFMVVSYLDEPYDIMSIVFVAAVAVILVLVGRVIKKGADCVLFTAPQAAWMWLLDVIGRTRRNHRLTRKCMKSKKGKEQ